MLKKLIFIGFLLVSVNSFATHNRAGEITFTHISGTTYQITVTTYTKASSPSDRPFLEISYCGGNLDSIQRISKTLIANDINKNVYLAQHTFAGVSPLSCIISVEDPNRTANIINIPNSVNTVFYIETELNINPFQGINNAPVLLNDAVDSACVNNLYTYNFGAIDVDGDSLYYTLQPCLKEGGQQIPSYVFPQSSNSFIINNNTGEVTWDTPFFTGLYNFDILIEEFRNGQKIGSVLREIQVDVKPTCVVGVDEIVTNNSLLAYPNPFNNELTINYKVQNKLATLEIYNLIGENVKTQTVTQNTTTIEMQHQPNGIYFVVITDGDKRESKKIIKQ